MLNSKDGGDCISGLTKQFSVLDTRLLFIERYQVFIEILLDMVQLGSKLMITLPIKKKNAQIL